MKKKLAVLLTMLMMVSVAGCSSNTESETSGTAAASESTTAAESETSEPVDPNNIVSTQDSLTVNISTDPGVIGVAANDAAITINKNIYEPLWMRDGNGEMQYRVAELIEKKDDLHYTVHIRPGVLCSDGHELTAEDILYSFQWARGNGASIATTTCIDLDAFELVDEYTFNMTLKNASLAIENELQDWVFTWEGAVEANPKAPAGAGPYMLENWTEGTSISLVRNPNYSFEEVPIERLTFTIVSEPAQIVNAMMAGNLDYVKDVPSSEISYIESSGDFEIYSYPAFQCQSLVFNMSGASIMDNLDARKAVSYAIDNASILQVVYQGYGEVANAPISQFLVDFQDSWAQDDYYNYNPDLAKQYMESSGIDWANETLVIATDGQEQSNTMAQMVQSSLGEIGITTEIQNYEYATYSANILRKPETAGWDLAFAGIQIGSGNAANLMDSWFGIDMYNTSGWNNQEFSDLCKEAMANYDEVGPENETKCVQMMIDELPVYTIIHNVRIDAKKTNLQLDLQAEQTLINTGIKRFSRAYFN